MLFIIPTYIYPLLQCVHSKLAESLMFVVLSLTLESSLSTSKALSPSLANTSLSIVICFLSPLPTSCRTPSSAAFSDTVTYCNSFVWYMSGKFFIHASISCLFRTNSFSPVVAPMVAYFNAGTSNILSAMTIVGFYLVYRHRNR